MAATAVVGIASDAGVKSISLVVASKLVTPQIVLARRMALLARAREPWLTSLRPHPVALALSVQLSARPGVMDIILLFD